MNEDIRQVVKALYHDEQARPIELADSQTDIFQCIVGRKYNRVQVMPHTRYGKSMTVGLGVLTAAATFPSRWSLVGGTKSKAGILMNVVNSHIFDNDYIKQRFIHKKGDEAEIRRHRNKNHITFDLGNNQRSEIFICTAREALGFGAPNVVEDESALIPDAEQVLVERMLGDDPFNNFLCKIGNPFNRNHFLKSYNDPNYHKIEVDCYRGLKEGRMSEEIINDMKGKPFFSVLYECKFPSAEDMDTEGWMYLISDDLVRSAMSRKVEPHGLRRLGVDVARGGRNFNVWVLRYDNYAQLLRKDHDGDLMSVAGKTIQFAKDHNVKAENISIDDVGVGGGVVDRCKEAGWVVNGVKEGASAEENTEYKNIRSEMYASSETGLFNWLVRGGALSDDEEWFDLTQIRYKKDGSGRTKLESKEDMLKRGIDSPDVPDALALTFAKKGEEFFGMPSQEQIKRVLQATGGGKYIGYDPSLRV